LVTRRLFLMGAIAIAAAYRPRPKPPPKPVALKYSNTYSNKY